MSLHDLSPEVLHLICEACSRPPLQELRLTCRKLHAVASGYFLPEVVTCVEAGDLERIGAVCSASGVTRKSIKSFAIQADGFDTEDKLWPPGRRGWLAARADFLSWPSNGYRKGKNVLQDLAQRPATPYRTILLKALEFFLSKSLLLFKDPKLPWQYHRETEHSAKNDSECFATPGGLHDTLLSLFTACPNVSALTVNFKHTFRRNLGMTNEAFLRSLEVPYNGPDLVQDVIANTLVAAHDAGLTVHDLLIAGAKPFLMNNDPPHVERTKLIDKYYQVLKHVKKLHLVFNGSDAILGYRGRDMDDGFHFITETFSTKCLVNWLQSCS